MLNECKELQINRYENLEAYLKDIDYLDVFGGAEAEEELDDYELNDLQKIRKDFQTKNITMDTLNLLCSYLSGCGGTVSWYPISKKESQTLKWNQEAIDWLKYNLPVELLEEYHHCNDWSGMICYINIISNHYFIESFLPG